MEALSILLVCGSPEPCGGLTLRALAEASDAVIAVDRGLDHCLAAGVVPNVYCGDADTVSSASLARADGLGVSKRFHTPHKDETDLELAFRLAREHAEGEGRPLAVTLACASGGKPDHALAIYGVLARHARFSPRIVEDGFEMRVLSPEGAPSWRLSPADAGKRFSEITLSPRATFSLTGFEWDFAETTMELLDDRGVSNVVRAQDAEIVCKEGTVAAFLFEPAPVSC